MKYARMVVILIGASLLLSCASNQIKEEKVHDRSFTQNKVAELLSETEKEKDFSWVIYRNAAFLMPLEWYKKEKSSGLVGAIAVSPENFLESNLFEHGFTLQVIPDFEKTHSLLASDGGLQLIKKIVQQRPKQDILSFKKTKGRFSTDYIIRYRDAPAGERAIIVHKVVRTIDITDTLHVFTYEALESEWEENWEKYGTTITKRLVVVPFLSAL